MRPVWALAVVLATALPAQQDLVGDLVGDRPVPRQRAVRTLLSLPPAELPVAALMAALPDARAAGVLAARADRRLLAPLFAQHRPEAWLAALPAAPTPWLLGTLADVDADGELRARALAELQDRGELRGSELAALLGSEDDDVARTAAALLVYEWREWPPDFWQALRTQPRGRSALLSVLAEAPRQAGFSLATAVARDADSSEGDRLLAIAAMPGDQLDRDLARAVVHAAASADDEVRRAMRLAAARLPDRLADSMIGELHQALLRGTPAMSLLPLLDRLGPKGQQALLGLCAVLDPAAREVLVRPLQQSQSPALRERARAALDGEIPLEPWLLGTAAPLLDREARIARVAALLDDGAAATQMLAFDTLREAKVYVPAMLQFAQAGDADPQRLRRLVELGSERVPVKVFEAALQLADARGAALLALERAPLPPRLEAVVLDLAGRDDKPDAADAEAACRLLMVSGSENAGRAAWALVRRQPRRATAAVDWLAQGHRPWVPQLWLTELAEAARAAPERRLDAELLDKIRLALAESGDRRTIDELVATASARSPTFVRRCRHALPDLNVARADRLIDGALACRNPDTAVEILLWAAQCDDDAVQQRLLQIWRDSDDLEVLEATVRGLLQGPQRAALLQQLQAALRDGRFDDRIEVLAYGVVASMPERLGEADVELLARLLLVAPLGEPDAELHRADMFAEGRAGFPMASAVVDRLRRDQDAPIVAVFTRVARQVAARPDARLLARQRLLCLWTAAAAVPQRQRELGAATAALLLAIPDLDGRGDGAAHWFLGLAAEAAADFAGAAAHFEAAAHRLLRLPQQRLWARILLGDRDVAAGRDPWAALAARAPLCRARAALAAGDREAALPLLAAAREFAGADLDTVQQIDAFLEQDK